MAKLKSASQKKSGTGKLTSAKTKQSKRVKPADRSPLKEKKSGTAAPKKPTPRKMTKTPMNKKILVPQKTKTKTTVKPVNDKKKKGKLTEREKKFLEIKHILISQRSALLEEAEVALNELPSQTIFPDLGDQATAETDRNFMLRLRGREQRLLKKIDEAIERIDGFTFGICEDCGEEIDVKRLAARPVTTMCIDCKTIQEEEEKLKAQ